MKPWIRIPDLRPAAAKLHASIDLRDILTAAGLVLLVIGIRGFSVPGSWIVAGVVLLYLGLWHAAVITKVLK